MVGIPLSFLGAKGLKIQEHQERTVGFREGSFYVNISKPNFPDSTYKTCPRLKPLRATQKFTPNNKKRDFLEACGSERPKPKRLKLAWGGKVSPPPGGHETWHKPKHLHKNKRNPSKLIIHLSIFSPKMDDLMIPARKLGRYKGLITGSWWLIIHQ